jgi:filamentous hemagglutinin
MAGFRESQFSWDVAVAAGTGAYGAWKSAGKVTYLAAHEAAGGHTIERHVAKSTVQLLNRVRSGQRAASSFFSGRAAERVITETVPQDLGKVFSWLHSPYSRTNSRLVLAFAGKEVIGHGVVNQGAKVKYLKGAKVAHERDEAGSFKLMTAYPK